MPVYNPVAYAPPMSQKHTRTLLSLIFGTILGVIGIGVVGLAEILVFGYAGLMYPPTQSDYIVLFTVAAVLVGVALDIVTMWVLFFMRRYRAALYGSFVPMVFVALAFVGWNILAFANTHR